MLIKSHWVRAVNRIVVRRYKRIDERMLTDVRPRLLRGELVSRQVHTAPARKVPSSLGRVRKYY